MQIGAYIVENNCFAIHTSVLIKICIFLWSHLKIGGVFIQSIQSIIMETSNRLLKSVGNLS